MIVNNKNSTNKKSLYYGGLSRDLVLKIHDYTNQLRTNYNYGQRTIKEKIKLKFGVSFSESTISGWIHKNNIPYSNEKTQFKPKHIPDKKILYDFYIRKRISASRIAARFNVSIITAINWLRKSGISIRTHRESMNTPKIKKELTEKKLTIPKKEYIVMTPEKAYILGVLCGDGYIDKNFFKLEIRRDKEFIESFIESIQQVYGIKYEYYYYRHRNSYIVNIASQIICKDLLRYGTFRTFTWTVPSEILGSIDVDIIVNFLRGVFDSDGYACKYYIRLTCGSKIGMQGVSYLLLLLNIHHNIGFQKKKYPSITITHRKNLNMFKNLIGFTITRKNDKI